MSYGVNAYAKTQQQAPLSPRELEAHVLMKAAARLQVIRDNWADKQGELDDALVKNRKLWTILVAGVTDEGSPAPLELKQNIVNLGMFIFNHTIALTAARDIAPERLNVLININRQIAAGLRGGAPEQAPSAA
jgi:flagellar biosynthesis activator protein FlaF